MQNPLSFSLLNRRSFLKFAGGSIAALAGSQPMPPMNTASVQRMERPAIHASHVSPSAPHFVESEPLRFSDLQKEAHAKGQSA